MLGEERAYQARAGYEPAPHFLRAMCASAPEKFHFLFFCYCLRVKKGYSMGDCAPTTGGVHYV